MVGFILLSIPAPSLQQFLFLLFIIIPVVYNIYGAELAFGIPGILMCVAALIFWLGRKKYIWVSLSGIKKENFISITGYAILQIFSNRNGLGVWEAVGKKISAASIDGG